MAPTAKNRVLKFLSVVLFLLALFLLLVFSLMHLKFAVGLMIGVCLFALAVFFAAKKDAADIKHITVNDGYKIIIERGDEFFFIRSQLPIKQLHVLAKEIMSKKELYERIDSQEIGWKSKYDSSLYKLYRFVAMDMVLGYEQMGIPVSPYSYALQGVLHFLLRTNKDKIDYKFFKQAFKYFQHAIEADVKEMRLLIHKTPERASILLVAELLKDDAYLQKKYYGVMYNYWKTVAKSTGKLTEEEVVFLNRIADLHNDVVVD
ncbi:MAG: hypothetical protein IJT51_08825 [Bacteroidales bacterium]|nr:hypothetical protein [Bacteroidales bacterium]